MSGPLLYVFDDHRARRWAPFTLTRPVGELLFGCLTLRARTERAMGLPCTGQLTRRALAGFDEPGACPVVQPDEVPDDRARVLISSRVVLEEQEVPRLSEPGRLTLRGRTVGWVLGPGDPLPPSDRLRRPQDDRSGASVPLEGTVLDHPWDLVAGNPERIALDVDRMHADDRAPDGVARIGEGRLSLAAGAEVEPGVVVDTRAGPVRLDEGARVEGPARLVGPLYVGPGSTVLGGWLGASSIGPACKVRGEIADSVLLGYVNKAHDGFLGHALLGRWVNLGAMTTNSDLKNNYGSIRVWTLDGERDTGRIKVGSFLGDHVKTGIGTLLNTGTVIGAGSNVFGGVMPPTVVPPFSWGAGTDLRDYRLDRFLETAERSMARRAQALTPGVRSVLIRAWEETRTRRDV